VLSGQFTGANASFTPTLGMDLGSGTLQAGAGATVAMVSTADTTATATGMQAGGASIGSSVATATMSPTVFAETGNQQLTAGGDILVGTRQRGAHSPPGEAQGQPRY
jgi:ABC-type proline/glycine betaine transport system substrate-binding protein